MKPRIRTIKPEFFDDPETCDLPPLARLLFIGLWTQADRRGRLQDEPRRLKTRLLPHDRVDVDLLLDDLVHAGMILRYAQDDQHIIWIKNFEKHQAVNHREPESTLPAYLAGASQVRPCVPRRAQARPGVPMGNGKGTGTGTGTEGKGSGTGTGSIDRGSIARAVNDAFDRFWSIFPKKVGKGAARASWLKLAPGEALVDRILAGVERQKRSAQWLREGGRYIPNPATWLNQQRWDDDPDPEVPQLSDKTIATMRAGSAFLRGDHD